ncbi:MAG: response regulator transcription factor [Myxococcales bacterium]|nr:response regulator transcription factor [Myxococcales bacterium]
MSDNTTKILLVEDDLSILTGLSINLRHEGFEVLQAQDGDRALQRAIDDAPDLMILDVMLPGMNGFEVLKELRRRGSGVPIVMLSAKGMEQDKIMGLDLGADDYISKPFGISELIARIRAVLRRHKLTSASTCSFGCVEIDFEEYRVLRSGIEVPLTAQEFRLLRYLVEHQGRVITRQSLLEGAWGFDYQGTTRTVDNFIRNLRAKLEEDPDEPVHLLTVRGVGYRFAMGG